MLVGLYGFPLRKQCPHDFQIMSPVAQLQKCYKRLDFFFFLGGGGGGACNLLEINSVWFRLFTYAGQNWHRFSVVKHVLLHLGDNNNVTNSDNYNS